MLCSMARFSASGAAVNVLDFVNLYEYVIQSRERFLATFRELGWREVTRNREATWGSMRGIFIHMLEVEDSWLHYDISGDAWLYGNRDPSAFKSFKAIESYQADLAARTRAFLHGLTEDQLAQDVVFDWGDEKAKSSVQDVLIHAFVDEIAHLGELICLMWQVDVKPPHVNWIAERVEPTG